MGHDVFGLGVGEGKGEQTRQGARHRRGRGLTDFDHGHERVATAKHGCHSGLLLGA